MLSHRSKFDIIVLPADAYVNITRVISVFRWQNRKPIKYWNYFCAALLERDVKDLRTTSNAHYTFIKIVY